MSDKERELTVQNISFREDGWVEVTFIEARDTAPRAGLVKTVICEPGVVAEQLDDLFDLIEEMIDAALVAVRNPATAISRGE